MLHNKNYTGLYKKTFKSRVSEIDEFSYKIDRIITLAQYNRIQQLFSKENLTNAKSHFSLLVISYFECVQSLFHIKNHMQKEET